MDVNQPVRLLGHRCTLCVQWWATWCALSLIYFRITIFTPCRGASHRLSWTYWGALRREYGRGCIANNGTIWPCGKGKFSVFHWRILLTYSQIIGIVMDNASNNNTLVKSLESQCQQRNVPFSAQDARMRCMPHTIHLAAIKVLYFTFWLSQLTSNCVFSS